MDTDLTAELDRLSKIEQAATSGPWGTLERHGVDIADEGWSEVHVVGGPESEPLAATFISHTLETDNTEADTAFIVTARTAMPRLLAALRAAISFHVEAVIEDLGYGFHYCATCSGHPKWPCPEVAAITRALNGESNA